MTEVSVLSPTEVGDNVKKCWFIKNWMSNYQVIEAAEASLRIDVGDPKVTLSFFLCSKEKFFENALSKCHMQSKWYSLCAEVLTELSDNVIIKVSASANGDGKELSTESGAISLKKSKGKIVEVIDQFIYFELRTIDTFGQFSNHYLSSSSQQSDEYKLAHSVNEMKIYIDLQMFRLTDTSDSDILPAADTEKPLLAEVEDSLTSDLKKMFIDHQNYADLKLETKDHMTLDAHKFILAARSRYLHKYIDDAMATENFNGTIKMNINKKPLSAILHWMYTGELHENVGGLMEEIVDCAVLFELTQMIKLLDRKVITICNKENMFRLYQTAQKNGMPNAMDDISAYIREHV